MAKVQADVSELEKLLKSLKTNYFLRVGILGTKAKNEHDKDSSLTNAEIGTFHEFGTSKMPRRSFLEDSLKFKLDFNTNDLKPLKKLAFNTFFIQRKPQKFFTVLGAKCLEIIEEGFATNGFGKWAPLSEAYRQRKIKKAKGKEKKFAAAINILTDTGKLRRSISFKVMKNK